MKKLFMALLVLPMGTYAMETISNKNLIQEILTNEKTLRKTIKKLSPDMSRYLAQLILKDHPAIKFLLNKLSIPHKTLKGHDGRVFSAQFNEAGNKIVTASRDGMSKIWDVETGECVTLKGHARSVYSAHFNGAGDKVVTASDDGTAKIWDLTQFNEIYNFLTKRITFYQAFILNAIYEEVICRALVKKHGERAFVENNTTEELGETPILTSEEIRFDFNKYSHLEEHYTEMPEEIQDILDPYVTRTT